MGAERGRGAQRRPDHTDRRWDGGGVPRLAANRADGPATGGRRHRSRIRDRRGAHPHAHGPRWRAARRRSEGPAASGPAHPRGRRRNQVLGVARFRPRLHAAGVLGRASADGQAVLARVPEPVADVRGEARGGAGGARHTHWRPHPWAQRGPPGIRQRSADVRWRRRIPGRVRAPRLVQRLRTRPRGGGPRQGASFAGAVGEPRVAGGHSPVVPVRLPCGGPRRGLSLGTGPLGVLTACWVRAERDHRMRLNERMAGGREAIIMDVYEAVTSRRAVRGFKDEPVSREVLERVLSTAAWSPSGSNIQPWNSYVLTGAPLAELKTRAVERVCHGDPWDERQYEMYPPALKSPYGERRSAFGKERYSALGIAREDWEARQRAAIGNWNCFGAPAALFCYIDRDLGRPQWADVGMYLQTVMLLLRAEGLHSCPQMAWSQVRETVAEVLSPSDGLILFCGMSIGYEDPTVGYARTGRAPIDETVTFVGG